MIIDVQGSNVRITCTDPASSLIKTRFVHLSDLVEKLSSHRQTSFGLLPKDTRLLESGGQYTVVGMEFPPKRRSLLVNEYRNSTGTATYDVNLPGGIFLVKLSKEGGEYGYHSSLIYAVKSSRILFESDRLFYYPLPNVYQDGKICWGNVRHAPFNKLSAVEGLVAKFFSAVFNQDLFGSQRGSCPAGGNFLNYFQYLSEHAYQDDWLVPVELTMADVAKKLLRSM